MILEQLWRIITLSGNNDLRQGTKMTDSTKQTFINRFNDALEDRNSLIARNFNCDYEKGQMDGLRAALKIMGYKYVLDENYVAIDIVEG